MQHRRMPPPVPTVDRHRTADLATPRAIKAFRVLALQLSYKPLEARAGRLGHRDVDRLVARQNIRRGLMRRELIAAHRSPLRYIAGGAHRRSAPPCAVRRFGASGPA